MGINIIKGVSISVMFTLISLFVFSCLLVYTHISENLIEPVIIVITAVSILLGSSIGNRKTTKNGILNGALVGVFYIIILYIFSTVGGGFCFSLNLHSVIMIISRNYCRNYRWNYWC